MLKALSVRNYVLIDSLEIDFPEGLIIITGQTGAGKSIILGALSLLMGAKADAEAIAEGAETCSVEAEFETEGDAELLALLKENDLGEGGSLILRRVVNRSGRSRAFVNDIPVNLPLLTAVAGRLVDIHSQHQNLLLADHRFQLSALDLYAGNGELLEICRKAHSDLVALRSELSEVSARLASLSAERDYNESVFRRLDSASLKDGGSFVLAANSPFGPCVHFLYDKWGHSAPGGMMWSGCYTKGKNMAHAVVFAEHTVKGMRDPWYIDEHSAEPLSVEALAHRCGMSYSYFAKNFRQMYGRSCKEYIEFVRVSKAEDLLLFTDFDLTYISLETGFADCSHLIKVFRKWKGITPKQYLKRIEREQYKKRIQDTNYL